MTNHQVSYNDLNGWNAEHILASTTKNGGKRLVAVVDHAKPYPETILYEVRYRVDGSWTKSTWTSLEKAVEAYNDR